MKNKVLLLMFSFFTYSAFAGGSFGVGNGGDIIRCPVDQTYYNLDFILTKNLLGDGVQVVKSDSFERSMDRIENLIAKKLPFLKNSFYAFISNLNNLSDYSKPYIWEILRDLDDMKDEEFIHPPLSCQKAFGSPVEFYQAIIRTDFEVSPAHTVRFFYDPGVIKKLKNDVTQLSFLFVHEWLWEYVKTAKQNRRLNYYLHSTAFEKATPQEAESYFNSVVLKSIE